jgi:hypothetical protein
MGLSIRGYAEHRGCSKSAVSKALKEGRITREKDGTIDPEKADKQWAANSDPAQVKAQKARKKKKAAKPKTQNSKEPESAQPENPNTYIQSRAIRELYVARLRKLEYEEKAGQLVSVDRVTVRWFNLTRQLRDQLLAIPNRIDAVAAAETDRFTVNQIIADEIARVLEEFSKSDPMKL